MSLYEEKVKRLRQQQTQLDLQQRKKLQEIYSQSIKEIAKSIDRGGSNTLKSDYQRQLRQSLKEAEERLAKEIAREIGDGIEQTVSRAKELEKEVTEEILGQIDLSINDDAMDLLSSIEESVIKDIVGSDMYGDGKTLSDRIWRTTNQFGQDIDYIVGSGMAQQKSARELAKNLIEFTRPATKRDGKWIDDYSRLRTTNPAYNAMRLARTTINHAYQTATARNTATNPFADGIEWRTSGGLSVCPLCQDREGRIYNVKDLPMDHPNGMCSMIPVISKSLDEIGEELNAWVNGEDNPALDKWYKGLAGEVMEVIPRTKATKKEQEIAQASKDKGQTYKSTKEAFESVNWRNIDPEYAKELDKELLRVINKYPIDLKHTKVKSLKDRGSFGYCGHGIQVAKDRRKVKLIDEIMYSNHLQRNKEASYRMHLMNYEHRGSPLVKAERLDLATIAHEYGHAIDNAWKSLSDPTLYDEMRAYAGDKYRHLESNEDVEKFMELSERWAKAPMLSSEIYKDMASNRNLSDREFNKIVEEELGSYAASSKKEFIAEGFTNMLNLKDEDKSDFIKEFEGIFNEKFEKVRGK